MFWKRQSTTSNRKRPGRKRRMAGWLLLAIGVLITGVWGASRWWELGWSCDAAGLSMREGLCVVSAPVPGGGGARWSCEPIESSRLVWLWLLDKDEFLSHNKFTAFDFDVNLRIAGYTKLNLRQSGGDIFRELWIIPWPFALASLLGGGWLVWSGRRARRRALTGVCLKCGYDLAGLAAGAPCPECGKASA